MGSPPRMRGKGRKYKNYSWRRRITPAHAGKRSPMRPSASLSRDHPRVCGEKLGFPSATLYALGSPPCMRGKEILPPGQLAGARITPAYAGKSFLERIKASISRDHPRACGEKVTMSDACAKSMGSPPRVRGKGDPDPGLQKFSGITPAYAGKSPHWELGQRR